MGKISERQNDDAASGQIGNIEPVPVERQPGRATDRYAGIEQVNLLVREIVVPHLGIDPIRKIEAAAVGAQCQAVVLPRRSNSLVATGAEMFSIQ